MFYMHVSDVMIVTNAISQTGASSTASGKISFQFMDLVFQLLRERENPNFSNSYIQTHTNNRLWIGSKLKFAIFFV